MAALNTDTGTTELEKLIHSLEFENQEYVKMIEKENQLISYLESQIEEKSQETLKLEQDISRFDEDTQLLHRLYTNNRDNIESLRNTINVLSDHETALSRQLEVTKGKTEESRKFYEAQLTNYSSITDDYMKKYASFPLAVELETKKQDLAAVQSKLDDIKSVKKDLEGRIASKEDELDSKIMTRIVVKIAKTQLATVQLRKDFDERLAEKASLADKLKKIRTTEHTAQDGQCRNSSEDGGNVLSMEVDDMDDTNRQNCRNEIEGFSDMSITDSRNGASVGDGQQQDPHLDVDELSIIDNADRHFPGKISNTIQGRQVPEMNTVTIQPWPVLTHDDDGEMLKPHDSATNVIQLNQLIASDQVNPEKAVAEKRSEGQHVRQAREPRMPGSVKAAKLHFPLLPKIRPPPPIRMPVLQNFGKVSGQRMAAGLDTGVKRTAGNSNAGEALKPPSSQTAQISIPRLTRVVPPPPIHIFPVQKQVKLTEQATAAESSTEINKVSAPATNVLQDLRQKMSLLLPRPAPTQQNQDTGLSKTSELATTTAERASVDRRPWSLQFSNTQISTPSGSCSKTLMSTQVPSLDKSLPVKQQKPGSETKKVTVETENVSLPGTVRIQTNTVESSIKTTDVEVPTKGCDSPPSVPGSCRNLFSVNIQGFSSSETSTQSPTRKHSQSTIRRSPSTEGSHDFLLQSLFGNFEKKLNEDTYESDEEAAPTSIFSLFNLSENSGEGSNESPKGAGSFFTFGKFTDNGSPSPEGPSNLLNFFTKSQTSDSSSHNFAVTFPEDDKGNERPPFGLGVDVDERNEGPEKPLLNLF